MAGNRKRVVRELTDVTKNPPPDTKVHLLDESNVYVWEVLMDGPPESVYTGGHFKFHITLPSDYPFKPPVISFQTKIYHPNVSNDDTGSMCLGMLRSDVWKPSNKIEAAITMARDLLISPNPDDAVETAIADQYKNDRKEFDNTAKDWVKRYAK